MQLHTQKVQKELKKFQSLFCWKLFCNYLRPQKATVSGAVFQSLFCWKLFCNCNHLRTTKVIHPVSILVLLEAVLQPQIESKIEQYYEVSILVLLEAVLQLVEKTSFFEGGIKVFQSLFCWKLFCNTQARIMVDGEITVSILVLLEAVLQQKLHLGYFAHIPRFQSLFCWKLFCNGKSFQSFPGRK